MGQTSSVFAIFVNGESSNQFKTAMELDQSGPISLYLLIIGMEVMIKSIKLVSICRNISYFKQNRKGV